MKAISIKIFEDFATSEFLRDNILDFQFVTSNRTKEELTWKIVRNTTVLNRFIPFYVKKLYKDEIIFLCNELQIKTEGQIVDDLKRNILKKWNSDNPDILHHELIGKFSDKEFLRDYLRDYVFATTGKKDFLILIIVENLELHEFVLKRLFENLETDQLSEICIYLEQNKKELFEFSSLTNAGIMKKELSEQWNKTIFEINEKDDEDKESGFIEKLREIKKELDEAWQESGSAQTIDFDKLRKLKDDLTQNLKGDLTDLFKKVDGKMEKFYGIESPYRQTYDDNVFDFLENTIKRMVVNHANYQPVMIKTLFQNGGRCSKDDIVEALFDYNQNMNQELKYFRGVPVFNVLIGKLIVNQTNDEFELSGGLSNGYQPVMESLNTNQINNLIQLCNQKIDEASSYTTISEPELTFDFKNKNFFMINGPWVNWRHSLENRINEKEVLWATRGADPSDIGIFNKLRIGDLVFFSNSTKEPGPFSRKVIFGFGLATKKFLGDEPYWPDEHEKNSVIYKYRFSIKPIFETLDESEAIRWIQGLPFTKGFNSIVNPEKRSELSSAVMEKWNITEKSLEKTQGELDEEFYKNKEFEKTESNILKEQLIKPDKTVYPDQLNSEFSSWEEKVFRKITENNILFEPKPWTYPLNEISEGEIYVPDAELDGLCMCGRKVVVEAHENFSEDDAKKYSAFVLQYYQHRYLILIVPDEQKKIWEDYQKQTKSVPYRELWSETEANEKIKEIYQVSDKFAITQLPAYTICPKCQTEAKSQQQVFEMFGTRKRNDGRITNQSQCKKCR